MEIKRECGVKSVGHADVEGGMRFLLFYCCVRRFNSWMWVRRGGGVDDGARIGSLFAFRFSIWIGLDWIGLGRYGARYRQTD